MKNDKPHSIQKYWFILLCWFTSPMLLKTFLGITISKEVLAFGFVPAYWLFVLIAAFREGRWFDAYLEKHYPYEWKREKGLYQKSLQERRVRGFWQIKDGPLFTFAPADDEDWNKVKDDARGVVDFVLGSFFASGVFCVLYLIVGILD